MADHAWGPLCIAVGGAGQGAVHAAVHQRDARFSEAAAELVGVEGCMSIKPWVDAKHCPYSLAAALADTRLVRRFGKGTHSPAHSPILRSIHGSGAVPLRRIPQSLPFLPDHKDMHFFIM